eukprot:10125158-Prorocentrum_lima.AAC.1
MRKHTTPRLDHPKTPRSRGVATRRATAIQPYLGLNCNPKLLSRNSSAWTIPQYGNQVVGCMYERLETKRGRPPRQCEHPQT